MILGTRWALFVSLRSLRPRTHFVHASPLNYSSARTRCRSRPVSPSRRLDEITQPTTLCEKIHQEMLEIDYDRSGTIEFQEFVTLMRKVSRWRRFTANEEW